MNIRQAFLHMTQSGIDVALTCKYHNRIETHEFDHENYQDEKQYIGFMHQVKCVKNDFKDISTHYGGNKNDCQFIFSAK